MSTQIVKDKGAISHTISCRASRSVEHYVPLHCAHSAGGSTATNSLAVRTPAAICARSNLAAGKSASHFGQCLISRSCDSPFQDKLLCRPSPMTMDATHIASIDLALHTVKAVTAADNIGNIQLLLLRLRRGQTPELKVQIRRNRHTDVGASIRSRKIDCASCSADLIRNAVSCMVPGLSRSGCANTPIDTPCNMHSIFRLRVC